MRRPRRAASTRRARNGSTSTRYGPTSMPARVGDSDRVRELQLRIDQLQAQLEELAGHDHSAGLAPPPPAPPRPSPSIGACDEVSCVLNNFEGACCAKFKGPRATSGADML